ncbi:MAG: helix-turn-helix transcriptional regulator [Cyclobacteriaceae bacterium]
MSKERGIRFTAFLSDKKLSPTDLASEIGASRGTIYNYKNGSTSIKPDHLSTMEAKYGLSPEWYLHGRGSMYSYDMQTDANKIDQEIYKVIGEIFDKLPEDSRYLIKKLNNLLKQQQSNYTNSQNNEVMDLVKELRDKIDKRLL